MYAITIIDNEINYENMINEVARMAINGYMLQLLTPPLLLLSDEAIEKLKLDMRFILTFISKNSDETIYNEIGIYAGCCVCKLPKYFNIDKPVLIYPQNRRDIK
jgi:hypothetical protein